MKLFLRGFHESLRSEGCAPRRACTASGHYSFSDCALYCERCLRVTGGLAQATAFCNGRLLQSLGCRADPPISDRYRPGSVAMAARRRDTKRQLTAASDLRADFCGAHFYSLLETVTPPREGHSPRAAYFAMMALGLNDDHSHWTSRWNPQRRRNAVTCQESRSKVTSNICRTIRRFAPIDRTWCLGSMNIWPSPG